MSEIKENVKTVDAYVYTQEAANKMLAYANSIEVKGYEQVKALCELIQLIRTPAGEGTVQIKDEE